MSKKAIGSNYANPTTEQQELRCIYCQQTLVWPVTELYPSPCPWCGRGCGAFTVTTGEK